MARLLLFLIGFALAIYATIILLRQTELDMQGRLPRFLWLILIWILPVAGPIAWLLTTYVRSSESHQYPQLDRLREVIVPQEDPGPRGPDDDPEYLWRLEREIYRQKKQREQAENKEKGDDDQEEEEA